jgi:signal transduction histidine kinase
VTSAPLESLERLRREAGEAASAAQRLALLQTITSELSAARTAGDVGEVLVSRGAAALDAITAVCFAIAPEGLSLVAAAGLAATERRRLERIPASAPIPAAEVARTGEPLWLEEPAAVRARFDAAGALVPYAARLGALAAVPLATGGAVIGALAFGFAGGRRFEAGERELIVALACQCALALERAGAFDRERAARADAEESRGLLDAILENAPIGVGFVDRELRYVRVNPQLAAMDGLAAAEHVGRRPGEILPGLPTGDIEAGWRDVLRTGRPLLDVEVSGETPAAPGRRRTWLESWYPVQAGSTTIGLGTLVREVTREGEAEEFQRHVLGIVGHDLRNPLSAISTSAQLLRRAAGEGATATGRLADRILGNAERMTRIIAVLADFARIRAGQPMPVRRRACDLGDICRAVVEESEASYPGRVVEVSVAGEAAGAWDADRIAQVVANLLGNALDYSPPESAVRIGCRGEADWVAVSVENQGAPIPPEVLPKIFEPFRRAERDRPGGKDSLGLGLFIARAITSAHGGRIDVVSPPGGPTTFTIRLPRG